jgi:hypothetical protein
MVGIIGQKLISFVAMIDTIGTWTKHIGTIHIGPKRIGNKTYVDKTDRRQSVSVTKHIRDKTYCWTKRISEKMHWLVYKKE